MEVEQETYML